MNKSQEKENPNCFGYGSDNVKDCNCKKVFEEKVKNK